MTPPRRKGGVLAWLLSDDTGLSSRAIVAAWQDLPVEPAHDRLAYPYDPADFARCVRLMRLHPEARAGLDALALQSPVWAALHARWSEIEAVMEEETGFDRGAWKRPNATRTYRLMRSVIESAEHPAPLPRDTGCGAKEAT